METQQVAVNCNKCKGDFVINTIKLEKFNGGIERNYFTCPHCQEQYTAFYTNQKVRKNQTEMAALRWKIQRATFINKVNRFLKQIEALRKDNEKEMNRLREEMGRR
ncbi:hypothetical protein [Aneurinibacillus aneurinilyticus]|uniref:hypothetical protein n=1 Tax=Aneurinibacillus aneurinilyticus TaxID=1391 RepID=UPI0006888E8E|nr:hypothetical protein [Aneurinibacillus aneurinilyticus]MED0704936.1 hypothetical protein [Aneurinibacillus aneurinilyticus]MED0723076.1 hypothetical protein [Aneurinibacillus aneurinilyticus]MED0731457.1 hypothetical protein [Aneurinibacillus aneurinilyticus]MED0740080.1 hypothetical protein [Aneurinibacillus aneurinilyticus]